MIFICDSTHAVGIVVAMKHNQVLILGNDWGTATGLSFYTPGYPHDHSLIVVTSMYFPLLVLGSF